MTERENFLRLLNGEEPAWVPRYGTMSGAKLDYKPAVVGFVPSFLRELNGDNKDIFGVEFTMTEGTGGMKLPTPDKFILDDITKWRDVIKLPDITHVDWDIVVKKETQHIDWQSAVILGTHSGYFQHLMNFMGFTEGLCAMLEEPEEVRALFEFLADFYDEVSRNMLNRCRADMLAISDDTATALNPFISADMFRDLVKPYHARLGKIAEEYEIPVDMHCCGRCEDFIDDWREYGVRVWNPAQVMNDLPGIKKKYGNSLILCGCWDSSGPAGWPGAPEELVRSEVRKCIDTYAPGGGFVFWGSLYGALDDPEVELRRAWMTDEYINYGRTYYQRLG